MQHFQNGSIKQSFHRTAGFEIKFHHYFAKCVQGEDVKLPKHKILNMQENLDEVEHVNNFSYLGSTGTSQNFRLKLRIARQVFFLNLKKWELTDGELIFEKPTNASA